MFASVPTRIQASSDSQTNTSVIRPGWASSSQTSFDRNGIGSPSPRIEASPSVQTS